MAIHLGWKHDGPEDLQGNSFQPPRDAAGRVYVTRSYDLARSQLWAMQRFMYEMNEVFADHYVPRASGATRVRFLNSESASLGVSRSLPFRLRVNRQLAESLRGGQRPTWVFQRLQDLSSSPVPVDVFDTNDAPGQEGQAGASWQGFDFRPGALPPDGSRATHVWVMRRQRRRTASERGETYVHELVIHAWRYVKFGFQTRPQSDEAWQRARNFLTIAGHRAGTGHAFGQQTGHNLSDVEADLLQYYLRRREPHYDRQLTRPTHPEGQFQRLINRVGRTCEQLCWEPHMREIIRREEGLRGASRPTELGRR